MDPMGVSAYFFSIVPKQQTICPYFFVEKSNIRNFQQKLTPKSSRFPPRLQGLQLTEELDQASNVEDESTWVPTGFFRRFVVGSQVDRRQVKILTCSPFQKKVGKEIRDKNRWWVQKKTWVDINMSWFLPPIWLTLPKFNISPLKSYLPNRKVVFQPPFFRGELLNFGRGCILKWVLQLA